MLERDHLKQTNLNTNPILKISTEISSPSLGGEDIMPTLICFLALKQGAIKCLQIFFFT